MLRRFRAGGRPPLSCKSNAGVDAPQNRPKLGAILRRYLGSWQALFKLSNSTRRAGGFLRLFLVLAAIPTGLAAWAQEPVDPTVLPQVLDARVSTTVERARLILDLSAPTEFAIASLDAPNRIAVDVKVGGLAFAVPPDAAGLGIVASYTIEMAETGRARTLLTLNKPAAVQQAYVLEAVADQPAQHFFHVSSRLPEKC